MLHTSLTVKFQVPQFIEVEDKIFGPFTFKQFIYLGGGIGLSALAWFIAPLLVAIPIIGIALGTGAAFAFLKINSKPFINIVEAYFKYRIGSKLYIWRKQPKVVTRAAAAGSSSETPYVPKLSDSKLKDLAWSLDVHEHGQSTDN